MNIEDALKLKPGDRVSFPADRGSPAGQGIVEEVGAGPIQSYTGALFVWIALKDPSQGVWPSNRIERV